ncbi:hypothetical protein [Melittangium boletus]|uniref:hypothetical protein n=1 Tax=Melittangium boletus TaxID=83453 RepID=UPI003DA1EC91
MNLKSPLLLLATLATTADCKKDPPPAAHPPAPPAAAAPAPTPRAATTPALWYFRPVDTQVCEWVKQPLPSGERTSVTFNAECNESLPSWNPDGNEGLVFSPGGSGGPPRAWRVDFTSKRVTPLELGGLPGGKTATAGAEQPSINRLAFDLQGRPVAIMSDLHARRALDQGPDSRRAITFEGQSYPVPQGKGTPGLALAYRWEDGGWKNVEAKATLSDSEDSLDTRVLDTVKTLPEQTLMMFGALPGQDASPAVVSTMDAAFALEAAPGRWRVLATPGGPLVYRGVSDPEDGSLHASSPVRWVQEDKPVAVDGLTAVEDEQLGFQQRGPLLLVFSLAGDARAAHVLDTRTKKQLVQLKDIESAALWPEPSKE